MIKELPCIIYKLLLQKLSELVLKKSFNNDNNNI